MLIASHPLNPVFDYLKDHSLAELRSEHGVRFNVKGHLVTLAYDQFEAKVTNPIANLCRGLVIAKYDIFTNPVVDVNAVFGEAQLLAFPMVRFFNYGQGSQDNEFKPVSIYEKLDGTMAVVYYDWDMNSWNVATRNVPDGSNATNDGNGVSFRSLFERAILDNYGLSWADFGKKLLLDVTYVFELMTPENIVVVPHEKYRATLLAARATAVGHELDIVKVAYETGLDIPQSYPDLLNKSFDEMLVFVNDRDPLKNEGIVLVNGEQRMKMKSEKYVTYNKVHDLTNYDIVNYLLTGEIDDFIPLMNEYHKKQVAIYSEGISNWARNANKIFNDLNVNHSFASKKDLALFLQDPVNKPVYHKYARYIYRSYDETTCKLNVPEIQVCIRDHIDKSTGRYSHGFLQELVNSWI